MSFQYIDLLVKAVMGFVTALICGPLAIWIARQLRLIDVPGRTGHTIHLHPTPLAGGIVLALSLAFLLPVTGLWQEPVSIVLISVSIIFLFGLWDDARGLSASQKFIGQFVASIVLIVSNNSIRFLNNIGVSFSDVAIIYFLDWGITFFWFVGITNAFNLIDSIDGLSVGVAGISFAFFGFMASVSNQVILANFCALGAGLCLGIYMFNHRPARLFLGDAGALSLGFLLAAVAVLYVPLKSVPQGSSWFVPLLVLGYPIFDTTLVTISRLRRRTSIFKADRTHTYHRLISLGLKPVWAVLVIHIVSILLDMLALVALSQPPFVANIILGLVIIIGIGLIVFLDNPKPSLFADIATKENDV